MGEANSPITFRTYLKNSRSRSLVGQLSRPKVLVKRVQPITPTAMPGPGVYWPRLPARNPSKRKVRIYSHPNFCMKIKERFRLVQNPDISGDIVHAFCRCGRYINYQSRSGRDANSCIRGRTERTKPGFNTMC